MSGKGYANVDPALVEHARALHHAGLTLAPIATAPQVEGKLNSARSRLAPAQITRLQTVEDDRVRRQVRAVWARGKR
jgi:hypothetical protein